MAERRSGNTQSVAAAKAGMSERTCRRIEGGREKRDRNWRTRPDPFAAHWDEVVSLLKDDPGSDLQALTLLEVLQEKYPDQYPDNLLRTLQRRVKHWRATEGAEKEVFFAQTHTAGERALSDFTKVKDVVITIRGEVLVHLLYHFRLAFSGFCHLRVVLGGESYTALAEGMVGALDALGGVPQEHRSDSLAAGFRNLDDDERIDITTRYDALCNHYGLVATRNNRGKGHENGSIESPHGHFKRRLRQKLIIRGSTDFASIADYQGFIDQVAAQVNRRNAARIKLERAVLAPLPTQSGVTYNTTTVRVTRFSTVSLKRVVYSVPSRLVGERLRVHVFDDRLEFFVGQTSTLTLKRRRTQGHRQRQIDYRHVIGWLARKPRALAGLAMRDDLLPDDNWRQIYQRLSASLPTDRVCKQVVAALSIAAQDDTAEAMGIWWNDALSLTQDRWPTSDQIHQRFAAVRPTVTEPQCHQHDLAPYDRLVAQ